MDFKYDNINSFNIEGCRNGNKCYYLEKGICRFKHICINAKNDEELLFNKTVKKSNLFAIMNYIKNSTTELKNLINSYKNIQNDFNKTKDLKTKELFLIKKQKILSLKEKEIQELKIKNDTLFLQRIRTLSQKHKQEKLKFQEQNFILNNKINFVDKLIQEYNNKLDTYQCEKFKNFDKKKIDSLLDDNVCDICLTSISDIKGIYSVINILDCGHSFCYHCMHNLTKNKTIISCPTCRNEQSVNTIKRNIVLEKVIDVIKNYN